MPLIQVSLIEEAFTSEQKQQIIRKLTDAIVEIGAKRSVASPG